MDALQASARQAALNRAEWHERRARDRVAHCERRLEEARTRLDAAVAAADVAREQAAGAATHPTREERVRGAVATALEADGPELRTSTGRPVLSRVREISGVEDVSAAERDAAWEAVRGDRGG